LGKIEKEIEYIIRLRKKKRDCFTLIGDFNGRRKKGGGNGI